MLQHLQLTVCRLHLTVCRHSVNVFISQIQMTGQTLHICYMVVGQSMFILIFLPVCNLSHINYCLHMKHSTLNGTTRNHTKENRQLRRQSSSESDDSEKKRLKTVC